MRFKLDENLDARWRAPLEEAGHQVSTVAEESLQGTDDPNLAETCRSLGLLLRSASHLVRTGRAYQAVRYHVAHRACRFLCRRHKLRIGGTGRFGWEEVHGEGGALDLLHLQRRRQRSPAHARS